MPVGQIISTCLYALTLISIVAVVFLERKDPATTLVWILILSFLPGIGVLLYIFLGRGLKLMTRWNMRVRHEVREKHRTLPEYVQNAYRDMSRILKGDDYPFHDDIARAYRSNIALNAWLGDAAFTQDNTLTIHTRAKEHYDTMFQEIREAKESIDVMYFIISRDKTGQTFVELLAQKAQEGVKVRLIYDEVGSIATPRRMFRKIRQAGGEVYRFFPLRLSGILRANYRNHHKIVIVDQKIAYMGGINIGDNYLGLHKRIRPWRDTHMRIVGEAVTSLQMLFYSDLYYASRSEEMLISQLKSYRPSDYREGGTVGMQIVSSGPDSPDEAIKRSLCALISSAKKSVMIQSPYLMPDQMVLETLQNAAASGVKVQFMLPGVADKKMVYVVTNSYIGSLLDYGVEVYKHEGFLHAKMVVVDEEVASIGTCNFDMRSFALHFEANAFLYDREVGRQCAEFFREDLNHCTQVIREDYITRGAGQKFKESLLRVFAPLM